MSSRTSVHTGFLEEILGEAADYQALVPIMDIIIERWFKAPICEPVTDKLAQCTVKKDLYLYTVNGFVVSASPCEQSYITYKNYRSHVLSDGVLFESNSSEAADILANQFKDFIKSQDLVEVAELAEQRLTEFMQHYPIHHPKPASKG